MCFAFFSASVHKIWRGNKASTVLSFNKIDGYICAELTSA